MKNNWFGLLVAILLSGGMAIAQGTPDDYKRAFGIYQKYSDKVMYSGVTPQWIAGTHLFWYVRNTPEGEKYVITNADKKSRTPLFENQKLADQLAKASGKEVNPRKLSLAACRVNASLDTVRFVFNQTNWSYAVRKNTLKNEGTVPNRAKERHWMERDEEKTSAPVLSPDGKRVAFIKNDNIYVKELITGKETPLSIDGTLGNYYSAYIQWSPDSKRVVSAKIRPVEKRFVYYVESSPTDQLQPKLHKQEYCKPGDELPFKVPCIFEVETGKSVIPTTDLFPQQYDITTIRWDSDSRAVTFEYNQRGHQLYRVLELSAETGNVRPLIEESSPTFVNYSRHFRHDLTNGKEIIWMSERDNWNHLYLYNRQTAQVDHQITRGEWYVREVLRVDEEKKLIYFSANGMVANEDPYLLRYYRIGFDGNNLTCLTPEEGMHTAWFSADMKYLVDVYSKVDQAPVAVLRSGDDGRILMPLETADISRLVSEGWKAPEVFAAKGRDGQTDIWGMIVRPSHFDPNKKYPVIEYIYAGPGSHYVPKSFYSAFYNMTGLAELGFIVVQIDGMGTSFRSKAFEDVCYKNLKDAGFPDRKAWIKAASVRYPYMDIERVGIFGASAGGQESTSAVLLHPDFYKAAYSSCGCHDNRMDKIWWNEQWLGYPIGDQYKDGSNVENAHLLTRPLMLVVGEMDDNVDPASTMQVVNALVKANKDFELVVLPGVGHTMGEKYGEHKRYDFFVKHLLGVEVPKWELFK
ncbi:MAG: DPP IV N-terminal domain-containing protein [Bacteroides sp.]|uniref:S9 family peptidase n=3 Tax=Bacteroides sp. TaxID=29523 RepID=UPI001B44DD0F|nr:S9 family peptidase [Bacteroides sp.]MBP6067791.1 DPP IV N-terminal domain-containing protein [Bacteroides sp.]MBP8622141.1 DPP IV N-terminal domain-containing protein [Bacteroides sp.]MBP9586935.1 DPP IV N-terminal domain-containing protein [Bacteroides sp.]